MIEYLRQKAIENFDRVFHGESECPCHEYYICSEHSHDGREHYYSGDYDDGYDGDLHNHDL